MPNVYERNTTKYKRDPFECLLLLFELKNDFFSDLHFLIDAIGGIKRKEKNESKIKIDQYSLNRGFSTVNEVLGMGKKMRPNKKQCKTAAFFL